MGQCGEYVSRPSEKGPGKNHTFVGSYKLPLGQYTCIGQVVACSLQHRCPCNCQASIIALVTMASLPLICDGFVVLVTIALLPSSSWRCCSHCNGVVVIINVTALIACCQAGIVAINAQASLQLLQWKFLVLSHWRHCHCQCAGISAVDKLALSPSLLVVMLALSSLS